MLAVCVKGLLFLGREELILGLLLIQLAFGLGFWGTSLSLKVCTDITLRFILGGFVAYILVAPTSLTSWQPGAGTSTNKITRSV